MLNVNVGEAKTRLSQLLAAVESGETVRICRDGVPVAELRAVPRIPNPLDEDSPLRGVATILCDPDDLAKPVDAEGWDAKAWGF